MTFWATGLLSISRAINRQFLVAQHKKMVALGVRAYNLASPELKKTTGMKDFESLFLDTSGHQMSAPQYTVTVENIYHIGAYMHITIRNLGIAFGPSLPFFF